MTDPNLQKKLDTIFKVHMDAELSDNLGKAIADNPHLMNMPTIKMRLLKQHHMKTLALS